MRTRMISYFPDINVWMALSVEGHCHNAAAARWLHEVRREQRLIFSRYTQMGFLRLLTSPAVMGPSVLTRRKA
jgi:predicted nucleic acid-binding protein